MVTASGSHCVLIGEIAHLDKLTCWLLCRCVPCKPSLLKTKINNHVNEQLNMLVFRSFWWQRVKVRLWGKTTYACNTYFINTSASIGSEYKIFLLRISCNSSIPTTNDKQKQTKLPSILKSFLVS